MVIYLTIGCVNLLYRMSVDDAYFQQWYQMRTLNTGLNGECYGECKAEYMCELAAPNYALYTQCVENNIPANTTQMP